MQNCWGFPGGPVVKTWAFTDVDPGLIPRWETKIPQVMVWPKRKKKEEEENEDIKLFHPHKDFPHATTSLFTIILFFQEHYLDMII